jgi:hypothetical protein
MIKGKRNRKIVQLLRKDVGLEGKYLLVMRDSYCPEIRALCVPKGAPRSVEETLIERRLQVTPNYGIVGAI